VLPVEIEATEFSGRESSEQDLGTRPRRDPLLLQFLEINRPDEVLAFQVARLIAGVAIHEFKDQMRRISFILAARGPDHGAEAQILPVELKDVEEVSYLGTSVDREHLIVARSAGWRQYPKSSSFWAGKKRKAESVVQSSRTCSSPRPTTALKKPSACVVHSTEYPASLSSFSSASAHGHDLGRTRTGAAIEYVMEDIDVVGDAESCLSPVDHCAARDMALGFAIRRDQAGDTLLEIG
jgi:hypothetical protein